MSRLIPFALAALIATPAFALDDGTYPFTGDSGSGTVTVGRDRVRLDMTGSDGCTGFGAGPLLRGEDGAWATFFSSLGQECVVLGNATSLHEVGEGCREFAHQSCRFDGQLQVSAAAPVASASDTVKAPAPNASPRIRVAPSILKWRFDRRGRDDRRAVQRRLSELGLYTGGIDGSYGPGTEAGLIGYLQGMADGGEKVVATDFTFVEDILSRIADEGRAIAAPAPAARTAVEDGAPIYVGSWSCGGQTYAFTADRYRVINEYDGSTIQEGVLRPDGIESRTAYLELVGFGNLTFDGFGTRDLIMHDPSNGETWDCARR